MRHHPRNLLQAKPTITINSTSTLSPPRPPRHLSTSPRSQRSPRPTHIAILSARTQLPPIPKPVFSNFSTTSNFSSTNSNTMASDEEYQNFLDKANEGSGGVSSKSTGEGKKLKTLDSGVNVPGSLKELEVYYTSDTDEPFEEVGLKFDGGKLDGSTFSKLVNHDDTAEELSVKEFDPNGQYKEVIEAVKKATDGKGKIFRTGTEGARVEYWVVGIAKGGGSVIGMRAKAVES